MAGANTIFKRNLIKIPPIFLNTFYRQIENAARMSVDGGKL